MITTRLPNVTQRLLTQSVQNNVLVSKVLASVALVLVTILFASCAAPITVYDQQALHAIKTVYVAPFATPDSSSIKWSLPFYLGDSRKGFIDGLTANGFTVVNRSDNADAVFETDLTVSGYLSLGPCGGWDHYVDGLNTTLCDKTTGKTLLRLHHRNDNTQLRPAANGVALADLVHEAWQVQK